MIDYVIGDQGGLSKKYNLIYIINKIYRKFKYIKFIILIYYSLNFYIFFI